MARVVIEHLNNGAPRLRRLGDQVFLGEFLHVHYDRLLGLRHAPDWNDALAAALFRFRLVGDAESQNGGTIGHVQDVQLLPADLGTQESPVGIRRGLARMAVKLLESVAIQRLKRTPNLYPGTLHSR